MDELAEILLERARALDRSVLDSEPRVCARCLGRFVAKAGMGFSNTDRGTAVASIIGYTPENEARCPICKGTFLRLEAFAELCAKAAEPWNSKTFLVGSRFGPEGCEVEERLWGELKTDAHEPIKSEFNRELGKLLSVKMGKEPDFEHPDITLVVDTQYDVVDVQVAPLFVRGRYRKLARGIPQTRWPCKPCRGTGCERCNGTGKMYQTSVEEIIAGPVMEQTGGSEHFFHGMGREDVDALMLGDGRPFVLEIRAPRARTVVFDEVERKVNGSGQGVEVSELREAIGSDVAALKEARGDKIYRVSVTFERLVDEAKLNEVVALLRGCEIVQRTPSRVSHRRADRHRRRVVKDARVESWSTGEAVLSITAETGTYIKELVHGDQGRTRPSVAELLGVACAVKSLEVMDTGTEG
ncbi:MAG: tRNA pseudouridine(54/55) synthase Pus10 [Methanobacteriota archaeon]